MNESTIHHTVRIGCTAKGMYLATGCLCCGMLDVNPFQGDTVIASHRIDIRSKETISNLTIQAPEIYIHNDARLENVKITEASLISIGSNVSLSKCKIGKMPQYVP
jgi:hypothetical protein